jgi:hypothetical protein
VPAIAPTPGPDRYGSRARQYCDFDRKGRLKFLFPARSMLEEYPLTIADGAGHVEAIAKALSAFGREARVSIDETNALDDADTADLNLPKSRVASTRTFGSPKPTCRHRDSHFMSREEEIMAQQFLRYTPSVEIEVPDCYSGRGRLCAIWTTCTSTRSNMAMYRWLRTGPIRHFIGG